MNHIETCDECGSHFCQSRSKLSNLCPECAHILYGYANCNHLFENGRCMFCLWDGSRSPYVENLQSGDGEHPLFHLILTCPDNAYGGDSDDFCIGVFATYKQAEETAFAYLRQVNGFCNHPCSYRIISKRIRPHTPTAPPGRIWMVQGWNRNEQGDETDVIESDAFLTEAAAQDELTLLRQQHSREEWIIDAWTIGRCAWAEGFERL